MDSKERRLIEHLWFPVARSQDVGGDKPIGGRLLETDLVIFRTPAGLTIAEDRCPHRGAALSRGRMEGDELECSYHGWRFRGGDGRCTLVPSLPRGTVTRTVSLMVMV